MDPAEEVIPDVGLVTLKDPESGQVTLVNTRSRKLRETWRLERENHASWLSELFNRAGIDQVELRTNGPVVEPLARLFQGRRTRR